MSTKAASPAWRLCDGCRAGLSVRSPLRLLAMSGLAIALICGSPPAATGTSLHDALTAAYDRSPALDAERARLRAIDEGIPQASSGWRPIVRGDTSYGMEQETRATGAERHREGRPFRFGVSVTQPLFDGFRTRAAVDAAEARVLAGRARLRGFEAEVLLQAVTAYMDVVRDRALVDLNQQNVAALTRELEAARARRAVREVTITDVAQAEARHARALSGLDETRAALRASEAEYRRLIGEPNGMIRMPPLTLKLVPRTVEEAVQFALTESPSVLSARYDEQSARSEVDRIHGELLPQVQLEARFQEEHSPLTGQSWERTASVGARLSVPLYEGGETRARVRAAKHQHVGRIEDIRAAQRLVEARVMAAWSRLMAARTRLTSDDVQIRAGQTALDGVRAEQQAGQRTLLDVLNAEQELLEARAAKIRTQRDAVVAQYALLAEIGRLDAELLQLGTAIYAPEAHTEAARGKWFTTSIAQPDPLPPDLAEAHDARQAWRLKRPVLDDHNVDGSRNAAPAAGPVMRGGVAEDGALLRDRKASVSLGAMPPLATRPADLEAGAVERARGLRLEAQYPTPHWQAEPSARSATATGEAPLVFPGDRHPPFRRAD
ncbi:MAG: TolC family outer membrane protein [Hyphomicrobiaceae bacterium]